MHQKHLRPATEASGSISWIWEGPGEGYIERGREREGRANKRRDRRDGERRKGKVDGSGEKESEWMEGQTCSFRSLI